MKKFAAFTALAAALSLSAVPAQAGGWGGSSYKHNNYSSGLINVSPSVKLGNIRALNGILNKSPILSGNSILSGNNTGLGILGNGNGLLNNILGTAGGGKGKGKGKKRR